MPPLDFVARRLGEERAAGQLARAGRRVDRRERPPVERQIDPRQLAAHRHARNGDQEGALGQVGRRLLADGGDAAGLGLGLIFEPKLRRSGGLTSRTAWTGRFPRLGCGKLVLRSRLGSWNRSLRGISHAAKTILVRCGTYMLAWVAQSIF